MNTASISAPTMERNTITTGALFQIRPWFTRTEKHGDDSFNKMNLEFVLNKESK